MGVLVRAACGCGYSSGTLGVGCGMGGPVPRYILAHCPACAAITSIPAEGPPACPVCRGQVTPLPRPAEEEPSAAPSRPQPPCPQCGRPTLEIRMVGVWD